MFILCPALYIEVLFTRLDKNNKDIFATFLFLVFLESLQQKKIQLFSDLSYRLVLSSFSLSRTESLLYSGRLIEFQFMLILLKKVRARILEAV